MQYAALVGEPVTSPQEIAGEVVHRHDPPAPVQLDDSGLAEVEQPGGGRAQFLGIDQRLPDTHELPKMRQDAPDHVDLGRRPVATG